MKKSKMNVFMLVMVNLATTLSIKNWPFLSEYGLASVVFFALAMAAFFIPVSLVSAELASGWPEKEGIFGWVKEAFNEKLGFLAVWLLWIENVIWYPTMFAFIVATLSYAFSPILADNIFYNVLISLSLFWAVLLGNFFGKQLSGWINTVAVMLGTLIPGVAIIAFGVHQWMSGAVIGTASSYSLGSWLPDFSSIGQLGALVSMSLAFAGMEMNAVHAKDVENPKRNYPYAILISGLIIVVLTALGTLSVSSILPQGSVNYVTAIVQAFSLYLHGYGLGFLLPVAAVMIALGTLGGISAWLSGTSKSLLVAGKNGFLPASLCKENKHQVPVPILLLQGIIGSVMCLVFVTMPNLSSGFWTLTVLATQLYLMMYVLMFAAAIALRFKQPHTPRTYRIPGKNNLGMLLVAGFGLLGCVTSFGIGFIPPSSLHGQALVLHESYLIGGCIFFSSLPYLWRKFSVWKKGSEISPEETLAE